jgi:hypothetical protein
MFPDVHRELHRVNVMGDVVAIELSMQPRSGVNFRSSAQKWPKIVNSSENSCSSRRFS